MRDRALGVKPNSAAYRTMSLAALRATQISGFGVTPPPRVLINIAPMPAGSCSASFARSLSAWIQRAYAWQYAANGDESKSDSTPKSVNVGASRLHSAFPSGSRCAGGLSGDLDIGGVISNWFSGRPPGLPVTTFNWVGLGLRPRIISCCPLPNVPRFAQ